MCKCLPKVSTCEVTVNIRVRIASEEDIMNTLKMHYYVKLDLVLFKKVLHAQVMHTKNLLGCFSVPCLLQCMFETLFD